MEQGVLLSCEFDCEELRLTFCISYDERWPDLENVWCTVVPTLLKEKLNFSDEQVYAKFCSEFLKNPPNLFTYRKWQLLYQDTIKMIHAKF